jgi:hypothetical protein
VDPQRWSQHHEEEEEEEKIIIIIIIIIILSCQELNLGHPACSQSLY